MNWKLGLLIASFLPIWRDPSAQGVNFWEYIIIITTPRLHIPYQEAVQEAMLAYKQTHLLLT